MKESSKTNVKYGMLQGMYWMAQCTMLQFAVMLYNSRGYDKFSIGIASMLLALPNVLAQPLWGVLCDRRPKIKKLFMTGLLIAMGASLILPFSEDSMVLTVFAMMVIGFMYQPLAQVVDAWIIRMNANGYHINYAVVRSFGSMGYALTAAFYGILLDTFGMWLMTPSFIFCCLIFCFVVLKTKEPVAVIAKKKSEAKEGEESFSDILKKLVRNKQYLILIGTFMLMTTGMNAGHTFMSVKLTELGGGNLEYGLVMTIMSGCEMCFLLLMSKYGSRFRPAALMAIGYCSIIVKMLLIGIANSVPMIMLAHIFHGPAYGIMLGAVVMYIQQVVDHRSLFTAQTGYGACMGLGSILGSFLGGAISSAVGVDNMLFVMVSLPVASFLIMAGNNLFLRRYERMPLAPAGGINENNSVGETMSVGEPATKLDMRKEREPEEISLCE